MRRYTLISLIIGITVAVVVIALHLIGIYDPLAQWLNVVFTKLAVYPPSGVVRIEWFELFVICACTIWLCWCLNNLIQGAQKLIVMIIMLFVIGAMAPTLALYGYFFSPFGALSAIILAASSAFVFSATELGKRKRRLETVLSRRISKNTFNKLMSSSKPLKFESAHREVTVLTCRIYNRVELMDKLDPSEFLRMTNLFRRVTQRYLISKGAYLDEAGPELIRAYFGLIHDSDSHAQEAMKTALGLRECLKSVNDQTSNQWFQELSTGIGLSSGNVVSGIYGSKELFFLSGVGPQIDFSRRLAKVNKRYNSDIIIGPTTYKLIEGTAAVRPLEMFYDPDSGDLMEIYELLSTSEAFSDNERIIRDHYWQGVIQFREQKYSNALESFNQAKIPGKEDGPLNFFILATQEKLNMDRSPSRKTETKMAEDGHSRLLEKL